MGILGCRQDGSRGPTASWNDTSRAELEAHDEWLGLDIGQRRTFHTVQPDCARTPATVTGSRAQSAAFEAATQKSHGQVDERGYLTCDYSPPRWIRGNRSIRHAQNPLRARDLVCGVPTSAADRPERWHLATRDKPHSLGSSLRIHPVDFPPLHPRARTTQWCG